DSRAYSTNSQTGEKILMIPEPPDDEPSAILSTNNQQSINGQLPNRQPSNLSESKILYYLIALIIIFAAIIFIAVIIYRKRKSSFFESTKKTK
ncbi:MAG: hypothetical protein LBE18_10895, partial [Planctomycetaceae bacterium]|nr:hypothetical protein [Planctomycetaceae bacterium]